MRVQDKGSAYQLATNLALTNGQPSAVITGVAPGRYILRAQGSAVAGKLQELADDRTNWIDTGIAIAAAGKTVVDIGANASLRFLATGTCTGLNLNLTSAPEAGTNLVAGLATQALQTLTLSASTFAKGLAPGATIAAIQNRTPGSILRVVPEDGRLAVDNVGNLVAGLSAVSPGPIKIEIVEMMPDGTQKRTPFTLTVTAVTLATLTLGASSFPADATPGTVIAAISGKSSGSTLSIYPLDDRVAISGTNLVVGLGAQPSGPFEIGIAETHPGAGNSPRVNPFALTATSAVTPPAPGGAISLKTARPNTADSFYVAAPAGSPGGKGMAIEMLRGGGTNDAGTAHETIRLGRQYKADTIGANYAIGGYQPVAQSAGAWDYALGIEGSPGGDTFGGSVHGGETLRGAGQQTLFDGVAFNPFTDTVSGLKYQLLRSSRITWSTVAAQPGAYIDVDYALTWEQNNKIIQEATFTGGSTILADSAGYPIMSFSDNRYTQIWSEDGATLLHQFVGFGSGVGTGDYDFPVTQTGAYRMVDPETGDYKIIRWNVTGKTLFRIFCFRVSDYHKLYIQPVAGPCGTFTCYSETEWFNAAPPAITAPFRDNFNGSALSPLWKQTKANAGSTIDVSGGAFNMVMGTGANAFKHPINPTNGPGTYRVSLPYTTDTGATSAVASISRSDTTSGANALTAGVSLGAASGVYTVDFNIAEGETPWLLIDQAVAAGRGIHFDYLDIVKL